MAKTTKARAVSKPAAPAKPRRVTAKQKRRAALAAAHAADIEEHQRHFGESYESALDRVIAEQDELERLVGDILNLAA